MKWLRQLIFGLDTKGMLRCNRCLHVQHEDDWDKAMDAQAKARGSKGFINLSASPQCLSCGSTAFHRLDPQERLWDELNLGTIETLRSNIKEAGGSVHITDELHKQTLLHRVKRRDKAELLLQLGADVNARDDFGNTPLHEQCDPNVAALLIDKGADIAANNQRGETPLHGAAALGHDGVAKILLDRGANCSARDSEGNTPLHTAAKQGSVSVVKLLLETGSDPDSTNAQGLTPSSLAAREYEEWKDRAGTLGYQKHQETVKLFAERAARNDS